MTSFSHLCYAQLPSTSVKIKKVLNKEHLHSMAIKNDVCTPAGGGGGGVLPYKGLMGTCGQPGYVFWDFCL